MANIVASLPSIAAALLLLLVGVIAARLIRGLTLRLLPAEPVPGTDTVGTHPGRGVFLRASPRLVAGILFWITLFVL